MLYGMLGAMLLVALPVVVLAFWPSPIPLIDPGHEDEPRDTIVIEIKDITVEPDEPVIVVSPPAGGGPSVSDVAINPLVRPEIVSDDADIVESELGGLTGGSGIGPDTDQIWDPRPGGGEGVVFVPDTSDYEMKDVDSPPALIAMETPEYPPTAKRLGVEGNVLLHVLVGTDGKALDVRIYAEEPEGFGFGEYAARAARLATFAPAIHKTQAVRCWVSFPVVFELEDCR